MAGQRVSSPLWPERVTGLVSCEPGYNIQDIANTGKLVAPEAERRLWHQFYLNGALGYAGLEANPSTSNSNARLTRDGAVFLGHVRARFMAQP